MISAYAITQNTIAILYGHLTLNDFDTTNAIANTTIASEEYPNILPTVANTQSINI